ncbi:hypothetical protein ABW636_11305 [Aquimarina sp. 2201CG1-2-11]
MKKIKKEKESNHFILLTNDQLRYTLGGDHGNHDGVQPDQQRYLPLPLI